MGLPDARGDGPERQEVSRDVLSQVGPFLLGHPVEGRSEGQIGLPSWMEILRWVSCGWKGLLGSLRATWELSSGRHGVGN